MSTPLFGSTYGSRLNTDAVIGFSGGQKTYSSFIYTGFIGGGSLQSQELNELQEQNQFQTTKTNEFIGNWLKIEQDPIDSPIFTKQIDNKISYINPDVQLDIEPSVPEGYYLHNLTYFLKLPNLELPVSYDVSEFLNENILTEMINPFQDNEWKSVLQDTFNPDNLSPFGSHRKRYYSNSSSSIVCSARFHPNISEITVPPTGSQILKSIIRKNTNEECDGNFTVKILGTPTPTWIRLFKLPSGAEQSSLNFDSSDFNDGLTANFIIRWDANEGIEGITRSADIKLESDTSNGWPSTNLTQIKIKQVIFDAPIFNITSLVSLSNEDTGFSVDISRTTEFPGAFTVGITTDADWITVPTSENNFQFNSTQTISFNCQSQDENDEQRTATINFSFSQNGILIAGAGRTTTVTQSFLTAKSLLFTMPRLADLDIYGYSAVKSVYEDSIDTSPNLNLPYVFYNAANQWKYSNANSLDNYRYGTAFHRVNSIPQQSSLMFQAGSLGRFSDWSYWTTNAGSTYIRVEISELDTDELQSITVGDELYQFGNTVITTSAGSLPDIRQSTFAGKVMSKSDNTIELKILPIFPNSSPPTTSLGDVIPLFSPTIKYFYDQIGQLKNLNKLFPLYKTTSTKIKLNDSTIEYKPQEIQLAPNTQNNNPGNELIKELQHKVTFFPPENPGNPSRLTLSPLDLGDNARKFSNTQQVLRPKYSKYRYYDWIDQEVRGSIEQTIISGFFGNLFINANNKLSIPLGGYVQETTETRRWYELIRIAITSSTAEPAIQKIINSSTPEEQADPSIQWIRDGDGQIIDFAPLILLRDVNLISGDQVNDQFAIFIDEDKKLHALVDRQSAGLGASSIMTLHYFSPEWFAQSGVLIDENGPVDNPPEDGFVKVVAVGGHTTQEFDKVLMVCWLLHKSGKLYGVDIGPSIFKSDNTLKNIKDPDFYKIEDMVIANNIHACGLPGLRAVAETATFKDLSTEAAGIQANPPSIDLKKYIKYCLNLIPKINEVRCPVIDIVGGYRNHTGLFLCALPEENPSPQPINGVNQKIQFIFPSIEFSNMKMALYDKLKKWNSSIQSDGTWTYTLNQEFDSNLYDKLFKTKINNSIVYLPPRCYGLRSYLPQFWILTNNGIFATTSVG